jgi:putative MATE family efflux protein
MDHPSVFQQLVRGSSPMFIAYGTVALVGGIDAYFVSKLGTSALSAYGFIVAVTALTTNLFGGFGIGITACIARARGAGGSGQVGRIFVDATIVSIAFSIAAALLIFFTWRSIFLFIGAPEGLFNVIEPYMDIWIVNLVLAGLVTFGTAALRGFGAMQKSGLLLASSALLNLVLDPIFIFGFSTVPGHGLQGAAIALLVSNGIVAALIAVALSRQARFPVKMPNWDSLRMSAKALFSVSVPSMVAYAFVPLGMTVLTGIIASYGTQTVAAFGVASRLQALLLMVPLAVGAAVNPMVGVRFGAQSYDSLNDVARQGSMVGLIWGALTFLVILLNANVIGDAFSDDPVVARYIADSLPILALSFAPASFLLIVCSALSASGRAPTATVLLFIRGLGASVPLAFIGGWAFGFLGVFAGIALANVLTALVARFYLARQFWLPSRFSQLTAPV